ncbi:hypothetical protein Cgig2_016551 [Carnegiea gigantea]|uniref:Reverse transcriptase n=1 Tax=Carnegiea gigantea TaxID=171969 RepID=A0A9Q1KXZ7_9CARY|nr:hypothetical protein Cgig2_016551 [Carnegiea gigantea]
MLKRIAGNNINGNGEERRNKLRMYTMELWKSQYLLKQNKTKALKERKFIFNQHQMLYMWDIFNVLHLLWGLHYRIGLPVYLETMDRIWFWNTRGLNGLNKSVGPAFTWSNRHGVARVYSKLDRVLMNEEAFLEFPEVLYEILPEGVSDHNPLQLTFGNQQKVRPPPFIFFNIIKKRHDINSIKAMRKENGELSYSKDEIGSILGQHFQNFLGVGATRAKPILDVKIELLKPINEDEIKIAMFSICSTKCPGPDGYGRAFNHFSSCSGLQVNAQKTEIVFAGNLPFKYLGVPIKPQRLTKNECEILVERMILKIRSWPAKKLTYASRIQHVNSVLMDAMLYWG